MSSLAQSACAAKIGEQELVYSSGFLASISDLKPFHLKFLIKGSIAEIHHVVDAVLIHHTLANRAYRNIDFESIVPPESVSGSDAAVFSFLQEKNWLEVYP